MNDYCDASLTRLNAMRGADFGMKASRATPGDSAAWKKSGKKRAGAGPKNRLATKPRTDLPIVVRSRQADDDLPEIWRYIAQGNAHAADGVLARIERALDPADPQSSDRTRTPGLRQDLRFFV